MPEAVKSEPNRPVPFWADLVQVVRSLPAKGFMLFLLAAWVLLFHFLGNSTLGYVRTSSLFGWWFWVHTRALERPDGSIDYSRMFDADEEAHAWFIPAMVLVLLWWRRQEIVSLSKRVDGWGLTFLIGALLVHLAGYMVQQARISMVAFFLGVYAITGLFWGRNWLRAALFPFCLFAFCVPLGAGGTEIITFPLRVLATKITAVLCHVLLGIGVVQNGTQLFDAAGSYQYEVAAACSGIRSLTAILAFGVIYGYVTFKTTWRRVVTAAAAFPLAVVANVFRLTLIVLAAEAFGQKAGNYVHESTVFSLAPYIPAIGGMLCLGWWMREDKKPRKGDEQLVIEGIEQKI